MSLFSYYFMTKKRYIHNYRESPCICREQTIVCKNHITPQGNISFKEVCGFTSAVEHNHWEVTRCPECKLEIKNEFDNSICYEWGG